MSFLFFIHRQLEYITKRRHQLRAFKDNCASWHHKIIPWVLLLNMYPDMFIFLIYMLEVFVDATLSNVK